MEMETTTAQHITDEVKQEPVLDFDYYDSDLQSTEDLKLPLKMDSCLLCGHSPAVSYDYEGNPIKKILEEHSYNILFSNLCHLLGVGMRSRIISSWNFDDKDPFPFCDECESLMTSLTELYCKFEKFEGVVRGKMREAEGKYVEEELYEKHDQRYYEFRKQVLKEHFQGKQKKLERKGTKRRRKPKKTKSTVKKLKLSNEISSNNQNLKGEQRKKSRKTPLPGERCSLPLQNEIGDYDIPTNEVSVLTDSEVSDCQLPMINSQNSPSCSPELTEDEDKKGRTLRRTAAKSCRTNANKQQLSEYEDSSSQNLTSSDSDSESPSWSLKPKSNPKARAVKKYKKRLRTAAKTKPIPENEQREVRKEESLLEQRKAFDEQFAILTKLSQKPKSEMSRQEHYRYFHSPILRDPVTNDITFFTGFGNRFMQRRFVIKFAVVPNDDNEEKILKYKCELCSEIVVQSEQELKEPIRKQTKAFRAHFTHFHMEKLCVICPPESKSKIFKNRDQLAVHLKEVHQISSIARMYQVKKFERDPKEFIDHKKYDEHGKACSSAVPTASLIKKSCWICGMPFKKINTTEFRLHLKTHMSEEEQKDFITTGRRHCLTLAAKEPGGIATRFDGNLCETCGKHVKGGESDMILHNKVHHMPSKEKHPCPLCGGSYSSQMYLSSHLKRMHPDGKPEGPMCKYPACNGLNFDTGDNLKTHILVEHVNSEENRNGCMCITCGKVFTSTWATKLHRNVHSGEKKFECHICPKTFSLKDTLTFHLAAVHREGEGMGNFPCEVEGCPHVFPCRVYLSTHLRVAHGIFKGRGKGESKAVKRNEVN